MKTEKTIKEERQRSAKKRIDINNGVNINKEIVYNYIAARKDVVGKTCVEELGFFTKGQRYLDWLAAHGYINRMSRVVQGRRHYVYNAVTPYIKPVLVQEPKAPPTPKQKNAKTIIDSVTRVINLLDREQTPMTKEERAKQAKRSSGRMSGMQSSMNMFGSW